jgi:hypothetical protein
MNNENKTGTDIISIILMIAFVFCAIYAVVDQIKESRSSKVSVQRTYQPSMVHEDADKPECQEEKDYILSQMNRIQTHIYSLENNFKILKGLEFDVYLANWNRASGSLADEINAYDYECFPYSGLKGLAALTIQLGLGYVTYTEHGNMDDITLAKSKIIQTYDEI